MKKGDDQTARMHRLVYAYVAPCHKILISLVHMLACKDPEGRETVVQTALAYNNAFAYNLRFF